MRHKKDGETGGLGDGASGLNESLVDMFILPEPAVPELVEGQIIKETMSNTSELMMKGRDPHF